MSDPETGVSLSILRAGERGRTELGWLESRHTFSFGEYMNARAMGFRSLRVINDDRVAPGRGFGAHPHRSMEIFSYVIEGELAHEDSMGNGRTIRAGELQYMSAGTGVVHSEKNPSANRSVHFLQIWILPDQAGGDPRYAELDVKDRAGAEGFALLASPDGRDGSIAMRQTAEIHFGRAAAGAEAAIESDTRFPHGWVHAISGRVLVGDAELEHAELEPGDGAGIVADAFAVRAIEPAEFLLFRLA